jgi:opacity protein-like surface antigen
MSVRFRLTLFFALIVCLAGASAQAQSAPAASSTPASGATASPSWLGPYAGGTFGHMSGSFTGPVSFATATSGSFTLAGETVNFDSGSVGAAALGGQFGYGFAVGRLVAGAEVQFERAKPSGSMSAGSQAVSPFIPADSFAANASWNMSFRGRIGRPAGRALVYGLAGLSFASVTMSGTFPAVGLFPAASGSDSHVLSGFVFGAGVEYAVHDRVSVGAEVSHTSYGSASFNLGNVVVITPPSVSEPALATLGLSATEFSVRVNVRFK